MKNLMIELFYTIAARFGVARDDAGLMGSILVETVKEVGATKQDILPVAGWSITFGSYTITQSAAAGVASIIIAAMIIIHKIIQIRVTLIEHKARMRQLES